MDCSVRIFFSCSGTFFKVMAFRHFVKVIIKHVILMEFGFQFIKLNVLHTNNLLFIVNQYLTCYCKVLTTS